MFIALRQSRSYPLVLLVLTGSMLGASLPFAKLAAGGGIPMPAFAFWQYLGGGLLLLAIARLSGAILPMGSTQIRYYLISGFISIALPNVLIFLAVAQIGTGLPGLAFAFPAMLTYLFALLLGMEKPVWSRALGIALGLAGALMIMAPRSGPIDADAMPWMLLALIAPVALAIGNIYRTRYWPAGVAPQALAAGTLLGASVWLLAACLSLQTLYLPAFSAESADWTLPAAMLFAGLSFLPYFELQRVAGPVYLSQIGYVIAATGLAVGALIFNEHYSLIVWLAVAVITVGIVLVNRRKA